ncbi:MAG: DUF423 domain-containing protein [Pirellulales bacterium]
MAGLIGAAAVSLGAYTAHGFEKALEKSGLPADEIAGRLNLAETAVDYHLLHALALLALAAAPARYATKLRSASAVFFLIGLACFSGVLYLKAFTGFKGMNLVVPAGGMAFIIGWLLIVPTAFVKSPTYDSPTNDSAATE